MEFLAGLLKEEGFEVELQEFEPGRVNLVGTDGPKGTPKLCVSGHLDVVPLGKEEWTRNPFAGEVEGDKIFGRGVSDMKGGVASLVLAILAAKREVGRPLNLALAFTGGEEAGFEGAKKMARDYPFSDPIRAFLVAEPTSNRPMVGHKGLIWAKGLVKGVTAHGAMPELGENAICKALEAIGKVQQMDFGVEPHPRFGVPTKNLGSFNGGMNVNSVPDRAEFCFDIRLIPGQDPYEVMEQLREVTEGHVAWEMVQAATGVDSDPEHPWIQSVLRIMEEIQEQRPEPECGVYVTDASILTPLFGNPSTLILGPGEIGQAHKTDEFCYVSKLEEAFWIYKAILESWGEGHS